MGEINHRSSAYRDLAIHGVGIRELTCRSFSHGAWRVECSKIPSLPRAQAKELVKEYLRREFEAKDFEFYAHRGTADTRFSVNFVTYAL